nr:hypothetical protein Ade03nite_60220 [Actinoplanes derwentensis]
MALGKKGGASILLGSRTPAQQVYSRQFPQAATALPPVPKRAEFASLPDAPAGRMRRSVGECCQAVARKVRRVISLGAKMRNGGPQKPVPRLV